MSKTIREHVAAFGRFAVDHELTVIATNHRWSHVLYRQETENTTSNPFGFTAVKVDTNHVRLHHALDAAGCVADVPELTGHIAFMAGELEETLRDLNARIRWRKDGAVDILVISTDDWSARTTQIHNPTVAAVKGMAGLRDPKRALPTPSEIMGKPSGASLFEKPIETMGDVEWRRIMEVRRTDREEAELKASRELILRRRAYSGHEARDLAGSLNELIPADWRLDSKTLVTAALFRGFLSAREGADKSFKTMRQYGKAYLRLYVDFSKNTFTHATLSFPEMGCEDMEIGSVELAPEDGTPLDAVKMLVDMPMVKALLPLFLEDRA